MVVRLSAGRALVASVAIVAATAACFRAESPHRGFEKLQKGMTRQDVRLRVRVAPRTLPATGVFKPPPDCKQAVTVDVYERTVGESDLVFYDQSGRVVCQDRAVTIVHTST
jgi:hypothetical protein